MATWPSTLPAPSLNGYGIGPQDQTIRTDMDAGNPDVRRRTTARVDLIGLSWTLDDTQMATFRTWFDDGTTGAAGGAAWFSLDLPTGAGGIASIVARFSGPFNAKLQPGRNWLVEAQIETQGA